MQARITVRMSDEMITLIDNWIAQRPGYVSRQEAVRQLVAQSLVQADQRGAVGADVPAAAGVGARKGLARQEWD